MCFKPVLPRQRARIFINSRTAIGSRSSPVHRGSDIQRFQKPMNVDAARAQARVEQFAQFENLAFGEGVVVLVKEGLQIFGIYATVAVEVGGTQVVNNH